ncbi:MAG: hypothetical protein AAB777_01460, partial [Patescibacteria group bacterium]
SKESAHDYRYFPEPDIPKMKISEIPEFSHEILSRDMLELPWKKRERFVKDYGATAKEAEMFIDNSALAKYFEEIINAKKDTVGLEEYTRIAINYLLTDYLGVLKKKSLTSKSNISESQKLDLNIPPASWAELISMIMNGELSSRGAKDIIVYLVDKPTEIPRDLAVKHALIQQNDPEALKKTIRGVIEANTIVVNEYKSGKQASMQYLIGQAMKVTKGSANPTLIKEILVELIG